MSTRNSLLAQPASPVFAAWFSQWKLGVLEPDGATFVLRHVLKELRGNRSNVKFWVLLAEFRNRVRRTVAEPETASQTSLSQWAGLLPGEQAKQALQFLGGRHAISEEHAFWRVVADALESWSEQRDYDLHPTQNLRKQ